jgi:hypothetical protein
MVTLIHTEYTKKEKKKGKGKKIETGKNLNPVQKIFWGSWNFWGEFPPPPKKKRCLE